MSLAIVFATSDYSVAAGDFRRVNVNKPDEYYDDTPKLFKVNANVNAAITGDCDFATAVIRTLKDRKVSDKATLEAVTRLIRRCIREHRKPETYASFLLTGKRDNGRTGIVKLTHENDFKPEVTNVKPGEIKWEILYANYDPSEWVSSEVAKLSEASEVSVDSVKGLCGKLFEYVSDKDEYVSRKHSVGSTGVIK
jgi:hypothetical protein